MRQLPFVLLSIVVLLVASHPAGAQYTTSDTLKAVTPGLVYKEFSRIIPTTNSLYRVTDPDATYVGEPDNSPSTFLPNPVLDFTVSDLQGAIKAVAVIPVWGGHVGTVGKQFRLNENDWIDIPPIFNTPTNPECYTHQYSIEVDVPIEDLLEGNNLLEGTSGGQTCYNFGWGQWGWYGFLLRVIYDPAQKSAPSGSITSPTAGSTIGENPVFVADAASDVGISRVEFVGYYDDFDFDGNGVFLDWQQSYHRLRYDNSMMIRNHIGTAENSPFTVTWDNAWVPAQQAGGIDVVARIRDTDGVWFVTEQVSGLTLSRPGINVKMYKPTDIPEKYWVRAGQTRSSNFVIPAWDDLTLIESARLNVATWNGISGHAEPGEEHWTKVNGWTTPDFGVNHRYSFDLIDIPTDVIQNGTNTVTFYSASSHHGCEILWPGPGLIARYDFSDVPASVTSHPSDTYALEGSTANFDVVAVGAEPLSFQWQRNGVDIPGAAEPTYTTPPVSASDDGDLYRCVVSNGLGSDVSDEAELTVLMPGTRITVGQIVQYDFEEGGGNVVNDVSGVGTPADLVIDNSGAVSWLTGALSVNGSTVIATAGAPAKLYDAVMASNEITIEAWVKPANLTQNGPARIVTLSADTAVRNFTLGQGVYGEASDVYEVRLRSTSTDPNGKPALATPDGDLTRELTHVVFTRDSQGLTKIYVDGVARSSGQTSGYFSNWNDSFRLGVANEMTGDRPWAGELHLVALFDRALPHEDVLLNLAAGPEPVGEINEINVIVSSVQEFGVPVSLFALPGGLGNPLSAAQSWDGVPGSMAAEIDATIGVQIVDGFGDPVVGFPADRITVRSQNGGWTQCPDFPLTADGPTDATGTTTISGFLFAGGHSGPGELLQVIVDDPLLNTTSYPGGLAGLEYLVNSTDITADLEVNLDDLAAYSMIFFNGEYDYTGDFVWDGVINLIDLAELGQSYGGQCPAQAGAVSAGGRSDGTRPGGTIGVVFDAAGTSSARMLEPDQQIDAFAVLQGPSAKDGIEAFDLRIRVSGNVVVHQQNLVGVGLSLPVDDGFVVGFPEPRRAHGTRPLQLVHLRVSVTDEKPAYFWVESGISSDRQPPAVASKGETYPVMPASGDATMPVASLNDEEFPLDSGNIPSVQLSMRITPNPFNPMTGIGFSLPSSGLVVLRVFDARGQLVTTLLSEVMAAGEHVVTWNGTDSSGRLVASGVYFSRLEAGAGVLLEKMMLVR